MADGRECGVQAWGRCATGLEAFCLSHAAYDGLNQPLVNRCVSCQTAITAQLHRARHDQALERQDEVERRAAAREYERQSFQSAFEAAHASGATPKDRRIVPRSKPKMFALSYKNGYRTIQVDLGPMWAVGQFKWKVTDPARTGTMERDARTDDKVLSTCILPTGDVAPVDTREQGLPGLLYQFDDSWAALEAAFSARVKR